jgi:S-adenosylmethionine hydrolase
VSATFHGRDIFAPVAAAIAGGAAPADAGEPLDAAKLITLHLPESVMRAGALVARVRYVDRFGNLQLNVGHEQLADSGLKLGRHATLELRTGASLKVTYMRTFAEAPAGELLIYKDAHRRLAIAVSHGDAADRLGLGIDDELRIRP